MNIPKGIAPYFKAATVLGIGVMIVDTKMSAEFGASIDSTAMIGLGLVSVASGIILVIAETLRRMGQTGFATAAAIGWAIAFTFNVWSNVGVATSTRMGEVQTATVQQTNYGERKKAAEEAELNLKNFGEQLNVLLTQNAWAATVKADGLREKAATLDKAIAEEGNKRNGGCKRRCLDLMNQKAALEQQIGVAERRRDIEGQIEATKKVLEKARAELASTKAGISATANASTLHAKLVGWNLAALPNEASVTVANESTGIFMAVVIAVMSALLTFIGVLPHLAEITRDDVPAAISNGVRDLQDRVATATAQMQQGGSDLKVEYITLRDAIRSPKAA